MADTITSSGCAECDGRLWAEGDETVCGTCGLVVAEDRLDRGSVWHLLDGDSSECEKI